MRLLETRRGRLEDEGEGDGLLRGRLEEGEGLRDGALGIGRRDPGLRGEPPLSWGDFRVENGDQSESLGCSRLRLLFDEFS